MRVGVLGSGFGLYGYLPALLGLGQTVIMPARYRDKLLNRTDVRRFVDDVRWAVDESEVLDRSQALVVARRPHDQSALIEAVLDREAIKWCHLEKPPAENPETARVLLHRLHASGRGVRIGLLFRFTPWAARCRDWVASADDRSRLQIRWQFKAHHYQAGLETWKRRPSQGGGAICFFGIHLIGLLAEMGYDQVVESAIVAREEDDLRAWRAVLGGPGLPVCELLVDSCAEATTFLVQGTSLSDRGLQVALTDPFDGSALQAPFDRRFDVVTRSCQDALAGSPLFPEWYFRFVDLWSDIEDATQVQSGADHDTQDRKP